MTEGKETGELVAGAEQAVADILPSLKDGFQPKDLLEIGSKAIQHIDIYLEAVKGISEVPAEVKEMKKSAALRIVAAALIQLAEQLDAKV